MNPVRALISPLLPILAAALLTGICASSGLSQVTAPSNIQPPTQPSPSAASPESGNIAPYNPVEQWNVLPLKDNNLHADPPLLGEKSVLPQFTRELIQVKWRARDPIDLYVIKPSNIPNPPAVLFLYGYPSDTDRYLDDAYCASVVSRGFAAVGFVSALTGQRYHDRPLKEWFLSELPESLGASAHDVQMILNYLGSRGDIDMQRIGMYGQGSGGTIALLAASVDPRLKAIDVLDPWGDWPDWMATSSLLPEEERASFVKPAFQSAVAPFDPLRWLPQLNTRPLRIQQTLFSKVTPKLAQDSIRAAAPSTAVIVQYKDKSDYQQRAGGGARILDWLESQLRNHTANLHP